VRLEQAEAAGALEQGPGFGEALPRLERQVHVLQARVRVLGLRPSDLAEEWG
jgi:hypothetical protein